MVKNLPAIWETWVWSLGGEDSQEEGKATHSSILAWRIPMDRGGWRATVHGVAKSQTQLSDQAHKESKIILTAFRFRYHALIQVHCYVWAMIKANSYCEGCSFRLFVTPWTIQSMEFSRKNIGVGQSFQPLSCVRLSGTLWIAAHQVSNKLLLVGNKIGITPLIFKYRLWSPS